MLPPVPYVFHKPFLLGVLISAALLAWTPPTQARVTRIIVDMKVSPAFGGASLGTAGQCARLAGPVCGELGPDDTRHAILPGIHPPRRQSRRRGGYGALWPRVY